ncbi:hypothetical protein, partial [Sporisorium scitamineum]
TGSLHRPCLLRHFIDRQQWPAQTNSASLLLRQLLLLVNNPFDVNHRNQQRPQLGKVPPVAQISPSSRHGDHHPHHLARRCRRRILLSHARNRSQQHHRRSRPHLHQRWSHSRLHGTRLAHRSYRRHLDLGLAPS